MRDSIIELVNTAYYLIMAFAFIWMLFCLVDFCVKNPFPWGIQWGIFGSTVYFIALVWGEL